MAWVKAEGERITDTFESGLSLVAVKNDTAVGTSVVYTLAGNTATWTTDVIPGGGEEIFYIRCSTTSCSELGATAAASWGCADSGGAPSCNLADSALVTVRCPLTLYFDEIAPGQQAYVDFTMRAKGCTNKSVQIVNATWFALARRRSARGAFP